MAKDWLKLHRSIVDTSFWHDDWLVRLWLWCLVKANYADTTWRGVTIKRGQFITGRNRAAEELQVSPSKWMRGIERLIAEGCISYEANSSWTMVTVCNYGSYQDSTSDNRTADDTSGDTTSGQPMIQAVIQPADTREEEQEFNKNKNYTHTPAPRRSEFSHLSQPLQDAIGRWNGYWSESHGNGKPDTSIRIDSMLARAKSAGWDDAKIVDAITFGITKCAKNWLDTDADFEKLARERFGGRQKPPPMSIEEIIGQ